MGELLEGRQLVIGTWVSRLREYLSEIDGKMDKVQTDLATEVVSDYRWEVIVTTLAELVRVAETVERQCRRLADEAPSMENRPATDRKALVLNEANGFGEVTVLTPENREKLGKLRFRL